MSKPVFGLGAKTTFGMSLLFLAAVGLIAFLAVSPLGTERNLTLIYGIDGLERAAQAINRRVVLLRRPIVETGAGTVAEVRRRHADLLRDLDTFSGALADLREVYRGGTVGNVLKSLDITGSEQRLGIAIDDTVRRFDLVSAGIQARLNDRHSEASLLSVADYLQNDERELFAQLRVLSTYHRDILRAHQAFLHSATLVAPWVLVLLLVLGTRWFQGAVIGRLRRTLGQCREVALGRSGVQAQVERNDGLGELVETFNILSARSHLIMTVLTETRRAADARDALRVIWEESNHYLRTDWMGLVELRPRENCRVPHAMPPIVYEPLRRAKVLCEESGLSEMLLTGEPLMINDLPGFAAGAANTSRHRFMRLIAERTDLRSMIALPARADSGWRAALVFASKEYNHFDEEDAAMMANLTQVMANMLAKAM